MRVLYKYRLKVAIYKLLHPLTNRVTETTFPKGNTEFRNLLETFAEVNSRRLHGFVSSDGGLFYPFWRTLKIPREFSSARVAREMEARFRPRITEWTSIF